MLEAAVVQEPTAPTLAIVGAGSVGATTAYAALISGVARRVVLHDIDAAKLDAEVADIAHGMTFMPTGEITGSDDIEVCRYLMVTNPMDVVTYAALRFTGLPPARLFGSGTVLDSARLRHEVASRAGVAVQNVHAYVVGEHGDSEFPLWSSASIGGVPLMQWTRASGRLGERERAEITDQVVHAAYRIIAGKGATNYAIGVCAARIVQAVLRDERRVMPVSTLVEDYHGVDDICHPLFGATAQLTQELRRFLARVSRGTAGRGAAPVTAPTRSTLTPETHRTARARVA